MFESVICSAFGVFRAEKRKQVARIQTRFHVHDAEGTKVLSSGQVRQLMAIAGSPQTYTQMYSIMVLADKVRMRLLYTMYSIECTVV